MLQNKLLLICEKKAQAYLLASFILAAFLLAAIISLRAVSGLRTTGAFEIENIKKELTMARISGIYKNDLNYVMSDVSSKFKNYMATKGFTLNLIFVAYDDNKTYVFGNYSGADCNYYNSVIFGEIPDGTTKVISKEMLLNDYSFNFCGTTFNLRNKFRYRLSLSRNEEVTTQ